MSSANQLCGILSYPACAQARHAVLLCSPHPNFAGNMQNNVISSLARELARDAVVLRFDYRGVGQSRISLPEHTSVFDYWEDLEERQDYADALEDAKAAAAALMNFSSMDAITVVGYSFGAVVSLKLGLKALKVERMVAISLPWTRVDLGFAASCRQPCLMISGRHDFVYDQARATRLLAAAGDNVRQHLLDGDDHFFREQEERLSLLVREFVCEHEGVEHAVG